MLQNKVAFDLCPPAAAAFGSTAGDAEREVSSWSVLSHNSELSNDRAEATTSRRDVSTSAEERSEECHGCTLKLKQGRASTVQTPAGK